MGLQTSRHSDNEKVKGGKERREGKGTSVRYLPCYTLAIVRGRTIPFSFSFSGVGREWSWNRIKRREEGKPGDGREMAR